MFFTAGLKCGFFGAKAGVEPFPAGAAWELFSWQEMADRAMAPNPLAQRSNMSRRLSAAGRNWWQCVMASAEGGWSVQCAGINVAGLFDKNEFLGVNDDVDQVFPETQVIGKAAVG